MTFTELAALTGKSTAAVQKAFVRKKLSIQKAEDVQAYLYLVFRPRQVRVKQPWRSTTHLAQYQYRAQQRSAAEVESWLRQPRRVGRVSVSATRQEQYFDLLRDIFLATPRVLGVVVATDHLLIITASGAKTTAGERARYVASQWCETTGVPFHVQIYDVAQLPSYLSGPEKTELAVDLHKGRLEYGWVALPM